MRAGTDIDLRQESCHHPTAPPTETVLPVIRRPSDIDLECQRLGLTHAECKTFHTILAGGPIATTILEPALGTRSRGPSRTIPASPSLPPVGRTPIRFPSPVVRRTPTRRTPVPGTTTIPAPPPIMVTTPQPVVTEIPHGPPGQPPPLPGTVMLRPSITMLGRSVTSLVCCAEPGYLPPPLPIGACACG